MKLYDKLKRLMEGRVQSPVAETAGIGTGTLSKYLKGAVTPGADIALRLARALEVPLEWLVDDEKGWPPPKNLTNLRDCKDDDLMEEMARRYRHKAEGVTKILHSVMEHDDWLPVARRILDVPFGESIPPDLDKRFAAAASFYTLMIDLNEMMPDRVAALNYGDLSDPLKANELLRDQIEDKHNFARQNLCAPVQAIIHYRMLRDTAKSLKKRREEFEFYREKLAEMLDRNDQTIDMDELMDAWDREQARAKRKVKA